MHALWEGAELLTGGAATTESLRLALAGADVVHVAAHGTHQQDSPLFSSLRVADGPLYAYELDAGDQPAPCVVLSACEAGLATVRPGDEGLGLTSVLLHLGSRSVLAGVARVRDDVAARVMQHAHASMAAGTEQRPGAGRRAGRRGRAGAVRRLRGQLVAGSDRHRAVLAAACLPDCTTTQPCPRRSGVVSRAGLNGIQGFAPGRRGAARMIEDRATFGSKI